MTLQNTASPRDTSRPVLILIHGATGNGQMWRPVRRGLDARIEVLTPDLPGHGSRRAERFTMAGAVATVVAAAASVAPAPVFVGGDSLGGYTSMASAQALPRDRLKGLVLSGCTMNFEGRAMLPLYLRAAIFRLAFAVYGEDRLIRKVLPKKLPELGVTPEDLGPILDGGISLKVWEQAVRELHGVDYRAKLAAIAQPVLILNGSKDDAMTAQEAEFLAVARHARPHRFEGAGHGVSMLRSAEFAGLINEFIERTMASGSAPTGQPAPGR